MHLPPAQNSSGYGCTTKGIETCQLATCGIDILSQPLGNIDILSRSLASHPDRKKYTLYCQLETTSLSLSCISWAMEGVLVQADVWRAKGICLSTTCHYFTSGLSNVISAAMLLLPSRELYAWCCDEVKRWECSAPLPLLIISGFKNWLARVRGVQVCNQCLQADRVSDDHGSKCLCRNSHVNFTPMLLDRCWKELVTCWSLHSPFQVSILYGFFCSVASKFLDFTRIS